MSDFKPYEKEKLYVCELTKDEALLIEKIRSINYGAITAHISNKQITRTETIDSELTQDRRNNEVTIAFEVITK